MIRTISNDDELWEALDGLYAYDTGCVDSGIHDEILRQKCIDMLKAKSEADFRLFISVKIREACLTDEAIAQGYGIEDAVSFVGWLGERMECNIC